MQRQFDFRLLELPPELITHVLLRCNNHISLCRLVATCKLIRDLEKREHATLWKEMLRTYCGESIFRGVLVGMGVSAKDILKDQLHRNAVQEPAATDELSEEVERNRTVDALNADFDFFFEIYPTGHPDAMLTAQAKLVNSDGWFIPHHPFSLETLDDWAAPDDWDRPDLHRVVLFAKHTPTNMIARVCEIELSDEGWGVDEDTAYSSCVDVATPSDFLHGALAGRARGLNRQLWERDTGKHVPFTTHATIHFRDGDQTKWRKISFEPFKARAFIDIFHSHLMPGTHVNDIEPFESPDQTRYVEPCEFEEELLRPGAAHLKWHACSA